MAGGGWHVHIKFPPSPIPAPHARPGALRQCRGASRDLAGTWALVPSNPCTCTRRDVSSQVSQGRRLGGRQAFLLLLASGICALPFSTYHQLTCLPTSPHLGRPLFLHRSAPLGARPSPAFWRP